MQVFYRKCIKFAFFLMLLLRCKMKKSNKITAFYITASVLLFLCLLGGGIYGIYLSIGINFMRSTVSNVTDAAQGGVSNVSYGATANFEQSMIGVIILSAILIIISIFYLISLVKQIVLFKQFKFIRESKITNAIEKKVKSKGSVIFFAFLINIISFFAGVAGIFVNINSFVDGTISWVLYVVDGLVILFAIVAIVLFIKKLHQNKKLKNQSELNDFKQQEDNLQRTYDFKILNNSDLCNSGDIGELKNIDALEYVLLKLKTMHKSGILSTQEYEHLRKRSLGISEKNKNKNNKSTTKNQKAAQ